MHLGSLFGRPLVNGAFGWIAGWIYDVWLDLNTASVAAFEICEPDRMQRRHVEPFSLLQSTRYGLGIDADPDSWRTVQRQMHWASLREIEDLAVITADGDRSCVITDADCDVESWRLRGFRIQRRWWEFLAPRTLRPERIVAGGANLLVVADSWVARQHVSGWNATPSEGQLPTLY